MIYIGYSDGIIIIYNLVLNKIIGQFEAHLGDVNMIKSFQFEDMNYIISSSKNNQIIIWEASSQ